MFVGLKPWSKSKTIHSTSHAILLLALPPSLSLFGCRTIFFNYLPFKSEAMSARTSAGTLQDPYVLCADDAAIFILSMQMFEGCAKKV